MGKSAGKWIKNVLFGKKNSKSNYSKSVTPDKKTVVKTPIEDPARDSSFISDQLTERAVENLELEKGTSGSQGDAVGVGYVDQGIDSPKNEELAPLSDEVMRRQEEAATKTQAVFRGYLARRAFRALKGIIRLQALIRGHLVRRQAVATLRSMQAIVKLQALARGRRVRLSDDMPEVRKNLSVVELQVVTGAHSGSFLGPEKLAVHPFIRKLLVKLPAAMPLSLQYDPAEPNSARNWVERWSLSRFWEIPVRTKKTMKPKPQRKLESEHVKSKRTVRKAVHGENGGVASSEMDKPKRIPRKITSQTEVSQEQSQSELERVKRNLRKVAASAAAAPEKPDPETEKPQPLQSVEIVATPSPPHVPEQEMVISPENPRDSDVVVDQPDSVDLVEATEKTTKDEPVDVQHDDHPVVETPSLENGVKTESAPSLDDEVSCKEEQNRKENQKTRKRRSLPAKPDYPENISQNSPSLPSYMAATESAKAKLRAQGSAIKLAEDPVDYNTNARRHSLPAPTNGKLNSLSPRIQKPVQTNGKGIKVNKSMAASRDDKGVQPGWRR